MGVSKRLILALLIAATLQVVSAPSSKAQTTNGCLGIMTWWFGDNKPPGWFFYADYPGTFVYLIATHNAECPPPLKPLAVAAVNLEGVMVVQAVPEDQAGQVDQAVVVVDQAAVVARPLKVDLNMPVRPYIFARATPISTRWTQESPVWEAACS